MSARIPDIKKLIIVITLSSAHQWRVQSCYSQHLVKSEVTNYGLDIVGQVSQPRGNAAAVVLPQRCDCKVAS
jgi:hypothetical protein